MPESPNKIRVLRVLEYTYPNQKAAEADMARWQLPHMGTRAFGSETMIRSAILVDLSPDEAESIWFARTHPGTERGT